MDAAARHAWLLQRQKGIGASDAPKLVGVGYKDALSVYRDKTTPPREGVPTKGPLARGNDLEPIVAVKYAELMDAVLCAPPSPIAWHAYREWQFASPDRIRLDDGRPVQLKTVLHFDERWGESGSDEVPDGYRVQVQQEMGVLGAKFCDLAALDVTEWELRVYRLAFDADLFAWLSDVEERFWKEHVLAGVPPTAEWEAQFKPEALARISRPGTRVELDAHGEAMLLRREELRAIKKEADAEFESLSSQIMALMGTAERADAGEYTVKKITVKPYTVPSHQNAGSTYLGKATPRKDK